MIRLNLGFGAAPLRRGCGRHPPGRDLPSVAHAHHSQLGPPIAGVLIPGQRLTQHQWLPSKSPTLKTYRNDSITADIVQQGIGNTGRDIYNGKPSIIPCPIQSPQKGDQKPAGL